MTYVKLLHPDIDDARWLTAGSDAFALWCAAMVWCDRQFTDGRMPKAMAAHVCLAVPPERVADAVAALLEHGFWTEDSDAYLIVDYFDRAFPAEQKRRTQEGWRRRQVRQRQHRVGDHEHCDPAYCPAAASRRDTPRESPPVSRDLDKTRTDKTRQDQTRPDQTGRSPVFGMGGEVPAAAAGHPTRERLAETSLPEPIDFYSHRIGDCAHMEGGRDEHNVTPGKIRCKDCARADKAKADGEQRAAARAEMARTEAEVPR